MPDLRPQEYGRLQGLSDGMYSVEEHLFAYYRQTRGPGRLALVLLLCPPSWKAELSAGEQGVGDHRADRARPTVGRSDRYVRWPRSFSCAAASAANGAAVAMHGAGHGARSPCFHGWHFWPRPFGCRAPWPRPESRRPQGEISRFYSLGKDKSHARPRNFGRGCMADVNSWVNSTYG